MLVFHNDDSDKKREDVSMVAGRDVFWQDEVSKQAITVSSSSNFLGLAESAVAAVLCCAVLGCAVLCWAALDWAGVLGLRAPRQCSSVKQQVPR